MPKTKDEKSEFTFEGFEGFETPRGTYTPDIVFDVLAPNLKEAELRVLLYIIRRTYGFKKDSDNISISQMVNGIQKANGEALDYGTGMGKPAVVRGLSGLQEKGIIVAQKNQSRERGHEATTYSLRFKGDPLFPKDTRGGILKKQGLVSLGNTQVTVEQETVLQDTEYSNSFELLTQKSKNGQTQSFSKKRKRNNQNGANGFEVDQPKPPRGRGEPKPIATALEARVAELKASAQARNGEVQPRRRGRPPKSAATEPLGVTSSRSRGRPKKYPLTPGLELFTRDITDEFHDSSKLPSNLSFIGRMLAESGLIPDHLYQLMQEARQITKGIGDIEKPSEDDPGYRNKFPYFRKTLLDLIEKEGRKVSARRNEPNQQGGVV